MRNKAFIWDLDGTLLDSYGVIVDSLTVVCKEYSYPMDKDDIHEFVIRTSVSVFIQKMSEELGIPFDEIKGRYSQETDAKKDTIQTIPGAKEALRALKALGNEHFVFTHRGVSTENVLRRLELYDFFTEIIRGVDGFPRKPEPDAINYLVQKYGLDKAKTYYVGDRTIDMDCAKNSGITGILYRPEKSYCEANGSESYIVHNLNDICDI